MSETLYAYYPVFRLARTMDASGEAELSTEAHAAEALFEKWKDRVSVRGVYSTVGFRPDADLMLWLVGETPDALQGMLAAFRRTKAGRGPGADVVVHGRHEACGVLQGSRAGVRSR